MVIFLSPIRDLVDDDREIAGRGHDEQAAPMAARFPHRADGPLFFGVGGCAVSYTHLRAHETVLDLVCRLLLEKKKNKTNQTSKTYT